MNDQHLEALLATHAGRLRELLPEHLRHLAPFKIEQFGPLTKYTLGQLPDGRWAMLHRLNGPDLGPPHDHPTRMDIFNIEGRYWEVVYHEDGRTERVLRAPGGHHTNWPHTVHSIVDLPEGQAWSLAFGHDVTRAWRHYPELLAAA